MMKIWKNIETNKEVFFIVDNIDGYNHPEDMVHITKHEDLAGVTDYTQLNIPTFFTKQKGTKDLFFYFSSFFPNETKEFWIIV